MRSVFVNIPNMLTLLRILLTPLFAICLLRHLLAPALLVFAVASLTDALDGMVARIFSQKTTLGAYLDPVADKLLLATGIITLAIQGLIPSWLAVIIITRDIIILCGVALLNIMRRDFMVKPSLLSKATTLSQIAVVMTVLASESLHGLGQIMPLLFWGAAATTAFSGLQYIYRGLNILGDE